MPDDPLPPDVLADALQDAAHRDIGIVRPAKVKRLTPAMEEARSPKDSFMDSMCGYCQHSRQDCDHADLWSDGWDADAALAKLERVVEAARDHRDHACTIPHRDLDEALAELD